MTLDESLRAIVVDAVAPVLSELASLRQQVAALVQASPPQFLSVAEFAQRNGLCQATVRRQAKAGALVCKWVGRRCLISATSLRPTDPAQIATLAREARS
ncbi:MAG: hypothetical protein WCG85_12515 [Polyangia bacterium]